MATEIQVSRPGEVGAVDTSVGGLMMLAIEKGDIDALERLVALRERVDARDARGAFFEALANFQEACPEIPKSRTANIVTKSGARYAYTYAPLEEITRTIRPHLRAQNLSYSWTVDAANGALNVTAVLRHIDGHEERSSFPVPTATKADMSEAQKNGAALTYGRRMSLISVLGLTTADEDTDAAAPAPTPETITDQQAADLDALIDEVGANRAKVLRFAKVNALADMTPEQHAQIVRELEARRAG